MAEQQKLKTGWYWVIVGVGGYQSWWPAYFQESTNSFWLDDIEWDWEDIKQVHGRRMKDPDEQ